MRKIIIYLLVLLIPQISIADELCFDMKCPNCTSYTAKHLRLKDFDVSSISGYIQANDNSWGYPIVGVVKGNNFVFARYNASDDIQYLYDIDLDTYNENTASGIRYQTQYRIKTDGSTLPYKVKSEKQFTFDLIACP